jgi:hypothetical protein
LNTPTRKTRLCTLETLDPGLRAAIRTHAGTYGLDDLEAGILMCCETISARKKKGLLGGLDTTLSAVFVTPRWLVWADSTNRGNISVSSAQLKHIDMRDFRDTAQYAITPDQGLNIIGRYTDKNRAGTSFIVLDSGAEGQQFRQVLREAMKTA